MAEEFPGLSFGLRNRTLLRLVTGTSYSSAANVSLASDYRVSLAVVAEGN